MQSSGIAHKLDLTRERKGDAAMTQLTDDARVKLGRKRDLTRDPEILDAALDVLAETGYDGMTIDMVATRAKAGKATLYRRWSSKADLVIDAVACMKRDSLAPESLPDTGSLRGDLVAMIRPHSLEESERKLRVMAGVMSLLAVNPELADAVREALVEPRASANRLLLRRAIDRGEIPGDTDVEMVAAIGPSMMAYRTLVMRTPVERGFSLSVIDKVVLPAVGLGKQSS
jgi:AcrR family transcriptional regulator